MTSESRTLIQAGDVLGVDVRCPECDVKITLPISSRFKLSANCPNCNKQWFDPAIDQQTGKTTYPAIDSLLAIAAHFRALNTTRTDVHAHISFQIIVSEP